MRAQPPGGLQRHRGMDSEPARFIAGRRHHAATVRLPADNDGLAAQLRTFQQFNGNKKRVHIHVQDRSYALSEGRGIVLRTKMS